MYVTVTVFTGNSVALNRRSHLFSTMSSLHDVLVHDKKNNVLCTLRCIVVEKYFFLILLANLASFQLL
jgi:hypothetical protein